MRETLKILGMKTSAYGFSYFITQAIYAVFTSIVISSIVFFLNFTKSAE